LWDPLSSHSLIASLSAFSLSNVYCVEIAPTLKMRIIRRLWISRKRTNGFKISQITLWIPPSLLSTRGRH
jgi:hypothetical protein